MREEYNKAEMEVIKFQSEDIVTASGPMDDDEWDD